MSDANAEKAQIRAYNEITRADYTPESIEAAIGKLWDIAIASRDAEVVGLREQLAAYESAEIPPVIQGDRAIRAWRRVIKEHNESQAAIVKAHAVIHGGSAPMAAQILADAILSAPSSTGGNDHE